MERPGRFLAWIGIWTVIYIIGVYLVDYSLPKDTVGTFLIVIGTMGMINQATLFCFYDMNKKKIKNLEKLI